VARQKMYNKMNNSLEKNSLEKNSLEKSHYLGGRDELHAVLHGAHPPPWSPSLSPSSCALYVH